jgi:hypothetical protein
MKAISLLQPWASLVVTGFKQWETRSWNTQFRGRLLIHASGRRDGLARSLCTTIDLFSGRIGGIRGFYALPLGAIIGEVTLVSTQKTDMPYLLSDEEFAFGDYSPGRWMWQLADPVHYVEPIPWKGGLSLWDYPGQILR